MTPHTNCILKIVLLAIILPIVVWSHSYAITWTNVTGVTTTPTSITSNPSPDNMRSNGAFSVEKIDQNCTGGTLQFNVNTEPNGQRYMIGLSDTDTNANFTSIDYAIYISRKNNVRNYYVYENGILKYSAPVGWSNGDTFSITRAGSIVTYLRNGVVFYTSAILSTSDLYIDSSIYRDTAGGYPGGATINTISINGGSCAILSVQKSDTTDIYTGGSVITYTISFFNSGSEAMTGFQIFDLLSTIFISGTLQVTYTGIGGNSWYTYTDNQLSGSLNILPSNTGGVFTLTGIMSPTCISGLIYTNTVYATGIWSGNLLNHTSSATGRCEFFSGNLFVKKNDVSNIYTGGQTITYTITISNTGIGPLTGFSLTDNYASLFDGTPNVSYIGSGGLVYSTSSNILSASTAILPAGFSGTFSIDGVFLSSCVSGTLYTNTVFTTGYNQNIISKSSSATGVCSVTTTTGNLTINKSDNTNTYTGGYPVSYTITFFNSGAGILTGLRIFDNFNSLYIPGTMIVSYNGFGGLGWFSTSSNQLSGSLSSIPSNTGGTFVITGTFITGGISGGVYTNTVYSTAYNQGIIFKTAIATGVFRPMCGDGIVNTGEQCDDGNISNDDGCSSLCQFEVPYCNFFAITPGTGYAPLNTTANRGVPSRVSALQLLWGDGSDTVNPSNPSSHTYTTTGILTVNLVISNTLSGTGTTGVCTTQVFVQAINGICGSVSGSVIYDFNNMGDSLTGGSSGLCDSGTVQGFVYDSSTQSWSWNCAGSYAGSSMSCQAWEDSCGDGIVQGAEGEECDSELGCDASCQRYTASCNDVQMILNPAIGVVPFTSVLGMNIPEGYTGTLMVWGDGSSSSPASSGISHTYTDAGVYTGIVTLTQLGNGSSFSCEHVLTGQVNGICGSVSGSVIYDFNNMGDSLTGGSSGLCDSGTVQGFVYDSSTQSWSWNCTGSYAGSSMSCQAWEDSCGDGIVQGAEGEECDSELGCDASCQRYTASCNDVQMILNPAIGVVPFTSVLGMNIPEGYTGTLMVWGDGSSSSPASSGISHTYTDAGVYTGIVSLTQLGNGSSFSCEHVLTGQVNGICGSVSGSVIYDFNNMGDSLTGGSSGLCDSGTVQGFVYDSSTQSWSWNCAGSYAGSSMSCQAWEDSCGDGIVQGAEGEECDSELGCDASCQRYTASCNDVQMILNPAIGVVPFTSVLGMNIPEGYTGTLMVWGDGSSSSPASSGISHTYTDAGVYTGIVSLTQLGNGSSFSCEHVLTGQVNGICGSVSGSVIYDFNNMGDSLTGGSSGLCDSGTVQGFVYDSSTQSWSWNCAGSYAGSSMSCQAWEDSCGDGIVQGAEGEECDSELGCDASCQRYTASCNDVQMILNPAIGVVPFTSVLGMNIPEGYTGTLMVWGDGSSSSPASSGISHTYTDAGVYTGIVTLTQLGNGSSFSCEHVLTGQVNGICGSVSGSVIYDFNNMGDSLTGGSSGLCDSGTVQGFVYDSSTQSWSWNCTGSYAGSSMSCQAWEDSCGDGIVQGAEGEECDSELGCDASCQRYTASCNDVQMILNPAIGVVPFTSVLGMNIPEGYTGTLMVWGDGSSSSPASSGISHTYTDAGVYTGIVTLTQLGNGSSFSCEHVLTGQVNGICGSVSGSVIYDFNNMGDSLTGGSSGLCDSGTVQGFVYDSSTQSWSWNCTGSYAGSSMSCQAWEDSCGDGIVQGAEGEECDSELGCDASCQRYTASCNDVQMILNPAIGVVPFTSVLGMNIPEGYTGTLMVWGDGSSSSPASSGISHTYTDAGVYTGIVSLTQLGNGSSFSCEHVLTGQVNGICGSVSGSVIYDFNNMGDSLTGGSSGLCDSGTVQGFVYDSSTQSWSWNCAGSYAGSSMSCQAWEDSCGDGIVQGAEGEECDSELGCDASCQRYTASCNDVQMILNPAIGVVPFTSVLGMNIPEGYTGTLMVWGDGSSSSPASSGISHTYTDAGVYTGIVTLTQLGNGSSFSCEHVLTGQVNGICGSVSGSVIYDFNNMGDSLTGGSSGLCDSGTVQGFVYDSSTQSWSWNCTGSYAGSSMSCQAWEDSCGDGIVQGAEGEECDSELGCDASCQRYTASCNDVQMILNPAIGVVPFTSVLGMNIPEGYTGTLMVWGDGSSSSPASSGISHTYTDAGVYTGIVTLTQLGNGSSFSCEHVLTGQVNGICGSVSGSVIYDFNNMGDSLTGGSSGLCDSGTVQGFVYDSSTQSWSWNCTGSYAGSSMSCQAWEDSCGDGIVQGAEGEECDSELGCDASCQRYTASCNDVQMILNPAIGVVPFTSVLGMNIPEGYTGTLMVWGDGSSSSPASSGISHTYTDAGVYTGIVTLTQLGNGSSFSCEHVLTGQVNGICGSVSGSVIYDFNNMGDSLTGGSSGLCDSGTVQGFVYDSSTQSWSWNCTGSYAGSSMSCQAWEDSCGDGIVQGAEGEECDSELGCDASCQRYTASCNDVQMILNPAIGVVPFTSVLGMNIPEGYTGTLMVWGDGSSSSPASSGISHTYTDAGVYTGIVTLTQLGNGSSFSCEHVLTGQVNGICGSVSGSVIYDFNNMGDSLTGGSSGLCDSGTVQGFVYDSSTQSWSWNCTGSYAGSSMSCQAWEDSCGDGIVQGAEGEECDSELGCDASCQRYTASCNDVQMILNPAIGVVPFTSVLGMNIPEGYTGTLMVWGDGSSSSPASSGISHTYTDAGVYTGIVTLTQLGNGSSFSCEHVLTGQVNGICGSVSGSVIYDFNNMGDSLTGGSSGLCDSGTVQGFVYDSSTQSWSWNCTGSYAGSSMSCQAWEDSCGDGIVQGAEGEECDSELGCDASCQRYTASCNDVQMILNPAIGVVPFTSVLGMNIPEGYTGTLMVWGDGSSSSPASSGISHTYTDAGVYTGIVTLTQLGNGSSFSCEHVLTGQVNGICGSVSGSVIYDFNNMGDSLTGGSSGLCDSGTVQGFVYDSSTQSWSWNCAGSYAGSSMSCQAWEDSCGDGIVQGAEGEECDSELGCDASCQRYTASCNDVQMILNPAIGVVPFTSVLGMNIPEGYTGTLMVWGDGSSSSPASSGISHTYTDAGVYTGIVTLTQLGNGSSFSCEHVLTGQVNGICGSVSGSVIYDFNNMGDSLTGGSSGLCDSGTVQGFVYDSSTQSWSWNCTGSYAGSSMSCQAWEDSCGDGIVQGAEGEECDSELGCDASCQRYTASCNDVQMILNPAIGVVPFTSVLGMNIPEGYTGTLMVWGDGSSSSPASSGISHTYTDAGVYTGIVTLTQLGNGSSFSCEHVLTGQVNGICGSVSGSVIYDFNNMGDSLTGGSSGLCDSGTVQGFVYDSSTQSWSWNCTGSYAGSSMSCQAWEDSCGDGIVQGAEGEECDSELGCDASCQRYTASCNDVQMILNPAIGVVPFTSVLGMNIPEGYTGTLMVWGDGSSSSPASSGISHTYTDAGVYTGIVSLTQLGNGSSFSCEHVLTGQVNGICGSVSGSVIYDFNNMGDSLTGGSSGLCDSGTVQGFVYDSSTQSWSWNCTGSYAGSSMSCQAWEDSCGDGIVQGAEGEECDSELGCDASCQRYTASCNDVQMILNPAIGVVPFTSVLGMNIPEGYTGTLMVWGDGSSSSPASSGISHTYTDAGVYTGIVTLTQLGNGSSFSCEHVLTGQVNGICGSVSGSVIYDFNNMGDSLTGGSSGLCDSGTVQGFVYDSSTQSWSWNCTGSYAGSSMSCQAWEDSCGDGIVQGAEGEECDSELGCDASCQRYTASCNDVQMILNPAIGVVPFTSVLGMNIPEGYTGTLMVWGDGSSSSPASSGISHTYTDAGVYTGIVSLTQLGNGSSFSCEHVLTGQVNGICGSVSGSVIYDFNNMGDSLTGGSSGLCDSGTVQGFVYDSSTQSWSWNCTGSYAGSSMSCQAWEDSCGDGIVQGAEGEECDSELGCDASCQRYTASCNDVQMILNPAIGVVPFTSVLGMNIPEGYTGTLMLWGDGSSSSPASSGISHTYTDAGVYTGIVTLTQLGNGSSFSCEHVLTGQVNGICGSVSGSVIYDFNNMGDSLTGGSSGLCDSGTVQGFVYDSSTQSWSWNCTGSYAGSSMSCQAWEDSCGDGIVQGAEGEECDSELGCDASCQRYTASCNDVQMILNPAIGVVPFTSVLGMNIPEGYTGTLMVWGDGSSSSPASSGISHTYTDAGVYTGIVTLTQLGNGSSFSCEHVLTGQVNGICGSVSGSVIYDFNNMGDSLTGGSSGLCDSGTVQGFVYDSSTQSWSWNCAGSYAGSSMSCQAWEDSCGDGIVQGAEGEECDSELGCDASCQRYTASCNDVQMILNPAIGVVPFTSVLGMNIPEGYTGTLMVWGDGSSSSPASSGISHTYTDAGVYTGIVSLTQLGNGSSFSCEHVLTGQVNGICGSVSGSVIYDFNNMGDSLTGGSSGLCDSGTVQGFVYDSSTQSWSWNCTGSYAGSSMSCQAWEDSCGDGIVQGAEGEECDSELGCDASCQRYTASCNDVQMILNPAIGVVPFTSVLGMNIPEGYTGTLMVWGDGSSSSPASSGISHTYTDAGVYTGIVSLTQLGNGSSFSCEHVLTGQVNGICGSVSGSVIYDFNNMGDSLTGGSSGLCDSGTVQGFVYDSSTQSWSWNCTGSYAGSSMSCQAWEDSCGDGIVQGAEGEECDDSNQLNDDGCNQSCQIESDYQCPTPPHTGPCDPDVLIPRGSIAGIVYLNQDYTPQYNSGTMDVLLSGYVVQLRSGNTIIQTSITNSNGLYQFNNLIVGVYSISYQASPQYQAMYVYPASGAIVWSITGIDQIAISPHHLVSAIHQFGMISSMSGIQFNAIGGAYLPTTIYTLDKPAHTAQHIIPHNPQVSSCQVSACYFEDGDFSKYIFQDVINTPYQQSVQTLLDHCIVHGHAGNGLDYKSQFGLTRNLTQGEAMKILARSFRVRGGDHRNIYQLKKHRALSYYHALNKIGVLSQTTINADTLDRDILASDFNAIVDALTHYRMITNKSLTPIKSTRVKRSDMSVTVSHILQIMDQLDCHIPAQKRCSFDDGSFDYQFSDIQDPTVIQAVKKLMQMCIIHGHSDSGERTKTGLYHPNRALTVGEGIKLIARGFGYRQGEHTQIIGQRSHRASVYLPALTMFEITLPTQDTNNMDQALSYTTFVRLIIDSLVLEGTLSSSAKSQLQAHLSSNHNQSITRAQAANILSIALQGSQSLLSYLGHQQ